jgi:hypothetical protein
MMKRIHFPKRYSLRFLFTMTLFVSIGLFWITARVRDCANQQGIVAVLSKMDPVSSGFVYFDNTTYLAPRMAQPAQQVNVNDFSSRIQKFCNCGKVSGIDLARIDDQEFNDILPHLTKLHQLTSLHFLPNCEISDNSLIDVSKLHSLTFLALSDVTITDRGIAHLAKSNSLKELQVENIPITDRALLSIQQIPHIEQVFLWNTRVTPEGVERLKRLRPDIVVDLKP